MEFAMHNGYLNIAIYKSRNEYKNALDECPKIVIMEQDIEQEEDYFIIKYHNTINTDTISCLGFISEGHGLKPSIFFHPEYEMIFLGVNNSIYLYNCLEGHILKQITTDSIIHSIIYSDKKIIIIKELGILALSLSGNKIWERSTGLMTSVEFGDETLTISTDDCKKYVILLFNGQEKLA